MMKCLHALACFTLLATSAFALSTEEEAVSIDFRIFYWPEQSRIAFPGQPVPEAAPRSQQQSHENISAEIPPDEQFVAPKLYFANGPEAEATLLDLKEGLLSPTYQYRGAPQLIFFKESLAADSTVLRTPMATTMLPRTGGPYVLILYPKGESQFAIFALNTQSLLNPRNNVMALNLTSSPLECALGETRFSLPVKGSKLLSIVPEAQSYHQALLVASPDMNGQLKKRMAQMITLTDRQKWILLLYNRAGNGDGISLQKIDIAQQSAKPVTPDEQG